MRFYMFHLRYRSHPGMVYSWLPAIAKARDLSLNDRAWLVWLNGNTQNPATSLLLLDAAPHWTDWKAAVEFWNDHFVELDWDTDRRHQKAKFGEATERWATEFVGKDGPARDWEDHGFLGWDSVWKFANDQPFMGRLSTWSMVEYARILLGPVTVPDAETMMLDDAKGSQSHRNGLSLLAGADWHDAPYWSFQDTQASLDPVWSLEMLTEELLDEALLRAEDIPDIELWHVSRLTLESALCTYKSWHKPRRRYPNVYADMALQRLTRAQARFPGYRFEELWAARDKDLPIELRAEDNPGDQPLSEWKQNHYRTTGQIPMMWVMYPDMFSDYDRQVQEATR